MRVLALALVPFLFACAASQKSLRASFDAPSVAPAAKAPVLEENHFVTDTPMTVDEAGLRAILDAPVIIEPNARVGVVPVAGFYGADRDIPVLEVPGSLSHALDDTGLFEAVSEVSTDFSRAPTLGGLRDLAARYRADYLLLYRHRFVDRTFQNPWAWTFLTGVGLFIAPAHSLETAGVLEATLFDVRTGTILFTTYERVQKVEAHDPWDHDRKRRVMKQGLLKEASEKLAEKVVAQTLRVAQVDRAHRKVLMEPALKDTALREPALNDDLRDPAVDETALLEVE